MEKVKKKRSGVGNQEKVDFKKLFKFKSFTEKIAAVHIDVTRKVKVPSQDPEEQDTFFNEGLSKWKEENCTLDFQVFVRGVHGKTGSLAQLVFHKEDVINHLKKCLQKKDTLAYKPLLDLLVQLARDLQDELYPYFKIFFPVLVGMCNTTEVEVIQDVFNTFAYLFKFLWRHMIKDLENVFNLFSELLTQFQKAHIRQFAAESFGFLLRKVGKQELLVDMMFSSLRSRPELCVGMAQLLFEVCRGVAQQFHSCTASVMPLLLKSLGQYDHDSAPDHTSDISSSGDQLMFQCLSKMVELMTEHTRMQHSEPLWTALLNHWSSILEQILAMSSSTQLQDDHEERISLLYHQLGHTLHLVGIATSWKRGSRIRDITPILELLRQVFELECVPSEPLNVALHLMASLLLVSQGHTHWEEKTLDLVMVISSRKKALSLDEVAVVIEFYHEVLTKLGTSSQPVLLQHCLEYCEAVASEESIQPLVLKFLMELCLKEDPVTITDSSTAVPLPSNQTFTLDLSGLIEEHTATSGRRKSLRRSSRFKKEETVSGNVCCVMKDWLGKGLTFLQGWKQSQDSVKEEDNEPVMELLWCAMVCARYVRPVQEEISGVMAEVFSVLVALLLDESVAATTQQLSNLHTLYAHSLASLVGMADTRDLSKVEAMFDNVLAVLRCCPGSLPVLVSSLQYLSLMASMCPVSDQESSLLSGSLLLQLLPVLSPNLSCALHPVRCVTLQILCLFDRLPSEVQPEEVGVVMQDVLEVCLKAEEVAPDIESYRGKLLWLQKLKYRPSQVSSQAEAYREIPLRYLVGVLHVNFSLLWDPTSEIIRSHAVEENKQMFWKVFGELLAQSSATVRDDDDGKHLLMNLDESDDQSCHVSSSFRHQVCLLTGCACRPPDHMHHRILLWKVLAGCDLSVVESRSRILVPIFLQFIDKEYSLTEDSLMETQNISKSSSARSTVEAATQSAGRKNLTKTLVAMLKVFTTFHNPKSVHKKEELWTLYMKLLVHNWTEIQSLALDGLLSFKPAYLTPYKENFDRLLDDKFFKEELINFRFDAECAVVSEDHKTELLPVLIRLLYGQMLKKGGKASKGGGVARKSLVLRFLGGCEGNELGEFINLLTTPFLSTTSKDKPSDSSCVVPLKRQQGFFNLLGQMTSDLGPKLLPHLPRILHIVIHLRSTFTQLLEDRSKIEHHFIGAVKNLRQLATNKMAELLMKFSEFDFTPYADQILSSFVWPQLSELPAQNLLSPTPLLKLLHVLTTQPHYWSLLSKPFPQSTESKDATLESVPILKYVFDCLHSPKVSHKICSFIMEMVVNLLTISQEHEEEIDVFGESSNEERVVVNGRGLVQPFIPGLLDYLSRAISESTYKGKLRKKDGRERNLEKEFVVLSNISTFVTCPNQSTLLIKLLLPFIQHTEQHKQQDGALLQSLSNLVVRAHSIWQHSRSLAQLFQVLKERSGRNALCSIFQRLADKDSQWTRTSAIISKLNAWDRRMVEEPDYDLRLEGYLEAKEMLSTLPGEVKKKWAATRVDLVSPILHNALYSLLESSDMSLRDAAASFVSELIRSVSEEDKDAFHYFILSSIVSATKQGLRSKQVSAQREFISILSELVRAYSNHQRFSDLHPLTHHDPDADFFLNVNHIQLHRRTRAFRKLAALCSSGSLGQTSCLDFILPLANGVVFSQTTSKEQNLLAEAVNVIGGVCAHLSWTHYSFLLRHYLRLLPKKIENQKNLIKAVITVLDNFHFDLSNVADLLSASEDADHKHPKSRKEQEEMDNTDQTKMEEDSDEMETALRSEDDTKLVEDDGVEQEEMDLEEEEGVKGVDDAANKSLVLKIYRTVMQTILPSLQNVLTKKIEEPGHKLSHQMGTSETDSEILRVPVAMAMTKLLLVLPEEQLHSQLPNVLLKVCNTLKHRSRDVRDVGRSTLVKMASSLGPKYLQYIIKEMKATLTRGYMLHVLSYSLHYLLHAMTTPSSSSSSSPPSPNLLVGDIDPCLDLISEILKEDLFGVPAEERESGEGVAKIPESKSPQSYNTYEIVARFLSPKLVPQLLAPIKEMLEVRSTSRTCRVVEEVFRRVASGVQHNTGFTAQATLVFIHGVLSNSVPQLAEKPRSKPSASVELHPPDSRLLPPAPGRSGPKPVASRNTSSSIVTEFGLQLLHSSLKHGKFDCTNKEQLQMLDPFLGLLASTLSNSAHSKVLCRTLHCLVWLLRLPLVSLPAHLDSVVEDVFRLIRRHARMGMAVGANKELVLSSFKVMTVVVRELKRHEISEDELRILLGFVDEDIHDYQRQSTAFPLLKAILGRKLVVDEMYDLMMKVMSLSLTSDSDHVRLQCRQAALQFLMDYPLGKKLSKYLDFYLTNLGYEELSGRESMLEQLNSIFNKFPERLLNDYSSYFFVPLSLRLINEESSTCKKMAAATLKSLMNRLNPSKMKEIESIVETWIQDESLLHRCLGILCLGLIIECEGKSFIKRLTVFLPHVASCLNQQQLEEQVKQGEDKQEEDRELEDDDDDVENEDVVVGDLLAERQEEEVDRLLFSSLTTLSKILHHCEVLWTSSKHSSVMNTVWASVHQLLVHPHSWVRLMASRLFGLLFAIHTPEDLAHAILESKGQVEGLPDTPRLRKRKRKGDRVKDSTSEQYLYQDTSSKVQDLCRISCLQLSSPLLSADLADQVTKNLVFLSKVLHHLEDQDSNPCSDYVKIEREVPPEESKGEKDLKWLVARMSRLARFEAGHHPKEAIKRTHIFRWIAAVSLDLGPSHLTSYLPLLLDPLHRELSDSSHRAGELHTLATEVVDLIKGVCPKEVFARAYAGVQRKSVEARERRKKEAVMEAVLDPETSMLRKRRKNELKKESKRRKVFTLRPDGTAAAKARIKYQ